MTPSCASRTSGKVGGAYVTVTGRVRHISAADRTVTMESGEVIPIDEITELENFPMKN